MDISSITAHRAEVDALIQKNAGQMVLVHWYDLEEHRSACQFGGGIKNKFPFEVQCLAVGILTGEPIRDEPWGTTHTKWILPVRQFYKTFITTKDFEWQRAGTYPQNLGGTYPSLYEAEDTGYEIERWGGLREARSALIIVGEIPILKWLESHRWFGSKPGLLPTEVQLTSEDAA